jgi:hypothetical protein
MGSSGTSARRTSTIDAAEPLPADLGDVPQLAPVDRRTGVTDLCGRTDHRNTVGLRRRDQGLSLDLDRRTAGSRRHPSGDRSSGC